MGKGEIHVFVSGSGWFSPCDVYIIKTLCQFNNNKKIES